MKAYYGDQDANDIIQSTLKKKLGKRSFFLKDRRIYLVPLSIAPGVLKAEGLIRVALNIDLQSDVEYSQVKLFRLWNYQKDEYKTKLDELFPLPQNQPNQLPNLR